MRLGPQRLHDLDLLLGAAAAIVKILVEADELDLVPADPDPEPEPAAAQHVETGRLLRDQRRLTLRQDQDAGRKPELARAAGEKTEQDKRIVEQIVVGVAVPAGPARRVDAEHMVGGLDKIVPDHLGRLRVFAHDVRIAADIAKRQQRAQLHDLLPVWSVARSYTKPAMTCPGVFRPRQRYRAITYGRLG